MTLKEGPTMRQGPTILLVLLFTMTTLGLACSSGKTQQAEESRAPETGAGQGDLAAGQAPETGTPRTEAPETETPASTSPETEGSDEKGVPFEMTKPDTGTEPSAETPSGQAEREPESAPPPEAEPSETAPEADTPSEAAPAPVPEPEREMESEQGGVQVDVPEGPVRVEPTKEGLTYVGPDRCKVCHKVQYASWMESKHAALDPPLDCESCHGPGSEYRVLKTMRDPKAAQAAGLVVPDAAFCANCHVGGWTDAMLKKAHAHKEVPE